MIERDFKVGDIFWGAWNNIYNSASIFELKIIDIKGRSVIMQRTALGLDCANNKINRNTEWICLFEFDESRTKSTQRLFRTTLGELKKGMIKDYGENLGEKREGYSYDLIYIFTKKVVEECE